MISTNTTTRIICANFRIVFAILIEYYVFFQTMSRVKNPWNFSKGLLLFEIILSAVIWR